MSDPQAAQATRESVVAEALSWIGTPYVLSGHVKGSGVDCATFLVEVLIGQGLATREDFSDLGVYNHDWYLHAHSERYLLRMMRHARKVIETVAYRTVREARPGDLVVTRTLKSNKFNHGAVVVEWPKIIHAVDPRVEPANAAAHPLWAYRKIEIYSLFAH